MEINTLILFESIDLPEADTKTSKSKFSKVIGWPEGKTPIASEEKSSGKLEDFLTGFIADGDNAQVYGRPVGVAIAPDGLLLVADNVSGIIWRIAAK